MISSYYTKFDPVVYSEIRISFHLFLEVLYFPEKSEDLYRNGTFLRPMCGNALRNKNSKLLLKNYPVFDLVR